MTEEIMPREDRMGKILSFIGGCIAGVAGVFAVAVMSEITSNVESSEDSRATCEEIGATLISPDNSSDKVD